MKISDKINQCVKAGHTFFSFEFFPPRTDEGLENLFERLDRLATYCPVFCDITWGAGGTTADVTLDIAIRMQRVVCVETMMHLTCTNIKVEQLDAALTKVKAAGLQNILALRGDPPKGQEKFEAIEGGFTCALDLVQHIRKEFGDYFNVAVAGYPETHPDTILEDATLQEANYWENIAYLKRKVEAGGEMIVTQLFYDVDIFLKFVADCRREGITVPIVPGIMPILTYGGFTRMTGFCKTKIPQHILDTLEGIKDDEEAVKKYGIEVGVAMCRKLLDNGAPGLHMYTLNLDKTPLAILEQVGLISPSSMPRSMPWRHVPAVGTVPRGAEAVRPLFWSNRNKSYVRRTGAWAAYPTSRWMPVAGDAVRQYSPLEGDVAVLSRHTSTEARKVKARAAWGDAPASLEDVAAVFAKYFKGEIALFPWADAEFSDAASPLAAALGRVVAHGWLPIHGRSAANAVASADRKSGGWGRPGGLVYQKAYLELFVPAATFEAELLPRLRAASGLSFLAASASGDVQSGGALASGPDACAAAAWGVYPGEEVVQPLVVDARSFSAWRDEAFALWSSEWAGLYAEGSASRQLLDGVKASWVLVSVLDDDYVGGRDLAALLLA